MRKYMTLLAINNNIKAYPFKIRSCFWFKRPNIIVVCHRFSGSRKEGQIEAEVSEQFMATAPRLIAERLPTRLDGIRHLINVRRLGCTCDS